jgi:RND family efflux transporter MFP subunit
MAVQAAAVSEVEWPETLEAPGAVRARTAAVLSSRAAGYIREIRPRIGDRVQAGDVVAVLEAAEVESALRQAQAAVDEARMGIPEAEGAVEAAAAQVELAATTLQRVEDLLGKKSVSQQEFDEAASRSRVARSAQGMAEARRRQLGEKIRQAMEAVAAAEAQRGYLEVRAPFAGRVTARHAEPGSLASPGMPLLELEQEGRYRLEAAVPESALGSVRAGQTVRVRFDSPPASVSGRVDEIVPEIDAASRSFLVKISLPAGGNLRSGLFGRALFDLGTRGVLAVPRAAVREQGQLRSVFVVEDGVARARLVRLGATAEQEAEVLSGLTAGERVIVPVPAGLSDGRPVEVTP